MFTSVSFRDWESKLTHTARLSLQMSAETDDKSNASSHLGASNSVVAETAPDPTAKRKKTSSKRKAKPVKDCILLIVTESSRKGVTMYLYTEEEYAAEQKEWKEMRAKEGKDEEYHDDDPDSAGRYDSAFEFDGEVPDDVRIVSVETDEIFTG